MPEPEEITPEPEEAKTDAQDAEVVAHSDDEAADDWCVINLSKL